MTSFAAFKDIICFDANKLFFLSFLWVSFFPQYVLQVPLVRARKATPAVVALGRLGQMLKGPSRFPNNRCVEKTDGFLCV